MRNATRDRWPLVALLAVPLLWCMFGLAACNTVEGAGKDIEKAGDSIQDAAD